MKKRSIHRKIIYRAPSRKICTCSMLTVTLLLLYRKFIPLRFLPWGDNLVTLGCCRILVFHCFSKVKTRRVERAFWVPSRQPLARIGWNSKSMLSERSPTKPFLRILIILLIKKLCLFFRGQFYFFPFQTLCFCKKMTNACAKNLRPNLSFWGQCVKKQMPC